MIAPGLRLFLASFLGLFLELACIRWIPGSVRLMGFYTNLVLVSSFLGLGLGCLLAPHPRDLRRAFAPLLGLLLALTYFSPVLFASRVFAIFTAAVLVAVALALLVRTFRETRFAWLVIGMAAIGGLVWVLQGSRSAGGFLAWIFKGYAMWGGKGVTVDWVLAVPSIFLINTALFIPLGQMVGRELERLPPLTGYAWNIAGSLLGVLLFAVASWLQTPPVAWFGVVFVGFLVLVRDLRGSWLVALGLFAAAIPLLGSPQGEGREIWSPYYKIELTPDLGRRGGFSVIVNHAFHQAAADLSDAALVDPEARRFRRRYDVLYQVAAPRRVLILGAGSGNDVAAALRAGVPEVDAVEIDPSILDLGRRLHPEDPYGSPRVRVHQTDARAFLRSTRDRWDLIAFGTLDSHTLFSSMASIRLDSYVYTRESIREAWDRLSDRGVLAITFSAGRPWIETKLYGLLAEASGRKPVVLYPEGEQSGTLHKIFVAGRDPAFSIPEQVAVAPYEAYLEDPAVTLPSDDWPHLYIKRRSLSNEYITSIVLLSILSVLLVRTLVARTAEFQPGFFLLGAAFLLLETKSVTYLALLFGSTWIVNCVVFSAILATALLSILAVRVFRPQRVGPWFVALALALGAAIAVHPESLLVESAVGRLCVASLFVAVPIFFSGVIFSTLFSRAKNPAWALGSNLMGAVMGGFLEYGSLLLGSRMMYVLALGFYLLVWLGTWRGRAQTAVTG